MDPDEFVGIIRRHERFVKGQAGGQRANLKDVDLSGLRLPGINLQSALLAGLNLKKSIVTGGDFRFADLFCANLEDLEGKETNFSVRICAGFSCMVRICEAQTFKR